MMKRIGTALVAALLAFGVGVGMAVADAAKAGAWTGFITDTHCGAKGANADHKAQCVESCVKGGSKAQILNDADQKLYSLDSLDKVKALIGKRVVVKGAFDEASKTIKVESAEEAASK